MEKNRVGINAVREDDKRGNDPRGELMIALKADLQEKHKHHNDTRLYAEMQLDKAYWQKIGKELDAQMKLHKMDFDEVVGTMERYANFRDTFGPKETANKAT